MDTGILFGSRVRAEALEALASTSKPLTGYRVAKITGAQPIQVQTVLKALQPEVVQSTSDGWLMVSDSLRRFLRDELARREAVRRAEKDRLLVELKMAPRRKNGRN